MKTFRKNILLLTVVMTAFASFFTACSDDDSSDKRAAEVRYVRVTDAAKSDSIVTSAYLGATVAIIGDNLSGVREIWFNDQQAKINPVYITNNAILLSIPNEIPVDVTNKIRLITRGGVESTFDFNVLVPAPILNALRSEYVADGDEAVIEGDYFIEPKVFFNGNQEAEILSFTKTEIKVIVPQGSKAGPVTVESIYGTTRSTFSFRDNNALNPTTVFITDFEDTSWNTWSLGTYATGESSTGQYLIFEGKTTSWVWPINPMQFYFNNPTRKPIVTEGDIKELALRFEANSVEWHDTPLLFWFSSDADTHNVDGEDPQAHWKPYLKSGVKSNYVTNGWVTITIPLTDFKYNKDESNEKRSITSLNQLVDLHAMFFGPADGEYPIKLMFDNFRIVKYK